MILQESKTVPIAGADWTDDGEVELVTFPTPDGYRTCMTPETARALAEQLNTAAADAEKAAAESGVQRAHRATEHGFDVRSDKQMHVWRWHEGVGDPVCSRCGLHASTSLVHGTTCPGPIQVPGVRS